MHTEQVSTFGLSKRDLKTTCGIFKKFIVVECVHIFGSRALDKQKPGSDIDLAIMNNGVTETDIRHIQSEFDESSLPYRIDLINFPILKHTELIDHIKRVGVLFYGKD